ncbi:MAG TPA: hypothetical protein VMY42_26020 [Thermoguttaceae bacterium]|nr:hypothetical protein [Thermoguttaceae bacterium]
MKRVLLTVAVLVGVGLAANSALAQIGYRGYRSYPSYQGYNSRIGGYSPHLAEVERIRQIHSRDRYQTHPRSYYNTPSPSYVPYDRGYQPGYYGGGLNFEFQGWGYRR